MSGAIAKYGARTTLGIRKRHTTVKHVETSLCSKALTSRLRATESRLFGEVMRTSFGLPVLLGALLLAAPSALAFEETRGSAGAPQAAPKAAAPTGEAPLGLGGTGTSVAPSAGTEVRIPGLGKLGILPKLDFGLELLYGVNEQSFDDRRLRPDQPDDGLGVRGTVRHRF